MLFKCICRELEADQCGDAIGVANSKCIFVMDVFPHMKIISNAKQASIPLRVVGTITYFAPIFEYFDSILVATDCFSLFIDLSMIK